MVGNLRTNSQEMSYAGLLSGVVAFFAWGILPLYWDSLNGIDPTEILAYRIIFSALFLVILLVITRGMQDVIEGLCCFSTAWRMLASSLLIGLNWYVFIKAISLGYILETSLGYYITPLVNVALGCIFLQERPSRVQIIGLLCAAFGVGWSLVAYGTIPWLALLLTSSFALYSFFRKTVHMEAIPGLFIETFVLLGFALAYIIWLTWQGQGVLYDFSAGGFAWLAMTGPFTSVPLALFAFAARHMPMTTLGLIQYIAPSIVFLLGIFVFDETLTQAALITFICIWIGIVIYSLESLRLARAKFKI